MMVTTDLATLRKSLFAWLRKATACRHTQTPLQEGRCECPLCGETVVHRWILLRCGGCHYRRHATYFPFVGVVAAQDSCEHCGSTAFYKQTLDGSLPSHHLSFAVLEAQSVTPPPAPVYRVKTPAVPAVQATGTSGPVNQPIKGYLSSRLPGS